MGRILIPICFWLQMLCLIFSRQLDPIINQLQTRQSGCYSIQNVTSRHKRTASHRFDPDTFLRKIVDQAEIIKRQVKYLQQYYTRFRVRGDLDKNLKLYQFRSALTSTNTSEVVYISAHCISELLNWYEEILRYEREHSRVIILSLEEDLVTLYNTTLGLECQLIVYLRYTDAQVSITVESNSERLSRILRLHNNRRVNFWRDLVVFMETEDLMDFIIENIES